jgi:hypothetical protein
MGGEVSCLEAWVKQPRTLLCYRCIVPTLCVGINQHRSSGAGRRASLAALPSRSVGTIKKASLKNVRDAYSTRLLGFTHTSSVVEISFCNTIDNNLILLCI